MKNCPCANMPWYPDWRGWNLIFRGGGARVRHTVIEPTNDDTVSKKKGGGPMKKLFWAIVAIEIAWYVPKFLNLMLKTWGG